MSENRGLIAHLPDKHHSPRPHQVIHMTSKTQADKSVYLPDKFTKDEKRRALYWCQGLRLCTQSIDGCLVEHHRITRLILTQA